MKEVADSRQSCARVGRSYAFPRVKLRDPMPAFLEFHHRVTKQRYSVRAEVILEVIEQLDGHATLRTAGGLIELEESYNDVINSLERER